MEQVAPGTHLPARTGFLRCNYSEALESAEARQTLERQGRSTVASFSSKHRSSSQGPPQGRQPCTCLQEQAGQQGACPPRSGLWALTAADEEGQHSGRGDCGDLEGRCCLLPFTLLLPPFGCQYYKQDT